MSTKDFKTVGRRRERGNGKSFLVVIFLIGFLFSLGAVLERKYSITAKAIAVMGNLGEETATLLPQNTTATVYGLYGQEICVRAELNGHEISCHEALAWGDYEVEWIPPTSVGAPVVKLPEGPTGEGGAK